jgi:hypothetical protein
MEVARVDDVRSGLLKHLRFHRLLDDDEERSGKHNA